MRKEKGGKTGKKKMDERQEEREKESGEVEERIVERMEEGTEEGTQETEERLELTEEACEEEERCEEDLESHSAAKRARVSSTFTDSQETAIVEFVKEHPELYDKEHAHFHDGQKKEALWAEISAELKLQPFDVRRWFRIPANALWQAVKTTIWPSPKGDDQETVLGLPADGFP